MLIDPETTPSRAQKTTYTRLNCDKRNKNGHNWILNFINDQEVMQLFIYFYL